MKLNKLVATALVATTIVSCGQQVKTKTSLETDIDSVSYAIGINMGQQMRSNGKEIDSDVFIQGFLNGRDSSNLLIPAKDTRMIINKYFQKKQAKELEEKFKDNKEAGEKFLADNKTKEGVKTTESGLQYAVVKEGNGEVPKATDKVKVHYHGTLPDGTVFDSSVDRGTPAEFFLNQVIKGWTEGLQLMKVGSKYKFYIPQELAYGPQQKGPKIKPFSALVFDVELLDIVTPEQK